MDLKRDIFYNFVALINPLVDKSSTALLNSVFISETFIGQKKIVIFDNLFNLIVGVFKFKHFNV
jgi:hypothetical protein